MSSAADAASALLAQYQAKLGNVAPKAVGIQLALVSWSRKHVSTSLQKLISPSFQDVGALPRHGTCIQRLETEKQDHLRAKVQVFDRGETAAKDR